MANEYQKVAGENVVYVGTYTGNGSEGIYTCQLDTSTGELRKIGAATNVKNPSYLAIDAERHRLYAVNELSNFGGKPGGSLSAFAIKPSSGELSRINQTYSHGGAPCYLTLDAGGRYLFVANYLGGNIAVIRIDDDGALGEATDVVTHSGSSLHPERQEGPHPHSIILDSANYYAFVPDLGLDKVMQYQFDPDSGQLRPNRQPWTEATAGSGPRHIIFHHNMRLAYVINELSSTITAYTYNADGGTLEPLQTISTVPEGYSGPNIAADLHLTPDARFLFGSNRGHDSIASCAVDQETGRLTLVDCWSSHGQKPRGFVIDPSGTLVLVANQDSDNIVTFWIDYDEGAIVPTGHSLSIPTPVCLKFVAVEAN